MAEITYRQMLGVIARLLDATTAEAETAEHRRRRINAKAVEAHAVVDRLAELEFDDSTKNDVSEIAGNFVGQARSAGAAALAANDLSTGAKDAANTIRRNHGGIHSAVNSAPVAPANRTAYIGL